MFSPREWGCTVNELPPPRSRTVLPTRVGVYRLMTTSTTSPFCSPHASGGVPELGLIYELDTKFSPREWGCTWSVPVSVNVSSVLPTRVGVYLVISIGQYYKLRSPHASGGVPPMLGTLWVEIAFSPRGWGCTDGSLPGILRQ